MLNSKLETFKLEIFIPKSHLNNLQDALSSVDDEVIGNYDSVLSYSTVRGTWRPLPDVILMMVKIVFYAKEKSIK